MARLNCLVVISFTLAVSLLQCGCAEAAPLLSTRMRGVSQLHGLRALLESHETPLLNHIEVAVPARQQEVAKISSIIPRAQASQALAILPTSRAAASAGVQVLTAASVTGRATSCKNVKCPANSKCGSSSGKIVCICSTGYVVKSGKCVKRDACTGAKCPANSACKPTNGKALCFCSAGYVNLNSACVLKDVCSGVKCPSHSTCKNDNGNATCYCDTGYIVSNNQCVLPDAVCAGVSCPPHSTCKNNNGKPACYCEAGYVVRNNQCVLPTGGDVCTGVKCPANSACGNNNGKAACFCFAGYIVVNNQCVLPSGGSSDGGNSTGGGGSGGGGGSSGGSGHDDWLSIHNTARAAVGVAPLAWSDSVASVALRWANSLSAQNCAMEHGDHDGLGQNLAWSSGAMTPQEAVQMWVDERAFWTYAAVPNGCQAGQQCGHYTQVVWKNTKEVGCAAVTCGNGGTIAVCDYNPPGNYLQQTPY